MRSRNSSTLRRSRLTSSGDGPAARRASSTSARLSSAIVRARASSASRCSSSRRTAASSARAVAAARRSSRASWASCSLRSATDVWSCSRIRRSDRRSYSSQAGSPGGRSRWSRASSIASRRRSTSVSWQVSSAPREARMPSAGEKKRSVAQSFPRAWDPGSRSPLRGLLLDALERVRPPGQHGEAEVRGEGQGLGSLDAGEDPRRRLSIQGRERPDENVGAHLVRSPPARKIGAAVELGEEPVHLGEQPVGRQTLDGVDQASRRQLLGREARQLEGMERPELVVGHGAMQPRPVAPGDGGVGSLVRAVFLPDAALLVLPPAAAGARLVAADAGLPPAGR
jgi:hypothetical protein